MNIQMNFSRTEIISKYLEERNLRNESDKNQLTKILHVRGFEKNQIPH